ncbi:mechanosensitive ion channel family protein [Roseobacter weihaiensis]|uniref:mechanosensitive ion channel family protein n=1 Tax=Roseobacter weihaiensis TaxID=2763262 RepID=UPI001D0AE7A1|nr:mechanosensitive ion channel family protein [Roseobacter sp. H9]
MARARRNLNLLEGARAVFYSLCLSIWIVPAAGAQTLLQPDPDAPAAPEQPVEIDPVAPDTAIQGRILDILQATGWYRDIRVEVDQGVAFLDGQTTSDAHRIWAQNLAAKTSGVVAVVNRIRIDDTVVWSLEPAVAELENLARKSVAALPLILLAVLVLPLAWYGARLVSGLAQWLLKERVASPFLRQVIARAIAFPVFLLGLYIVLQVAGLTQLALSLVGGAGVIGIVIGFAFRDIAENFLSSLILSVRRPFQRGDFIQVAGLSGTVKSMTTRSTLLTSVEGNQIHIPNSTVFKNVIENFTSMPDRRGDFMVGIGYDAAISEAQEIILDCLQNHEAVLAEPEPMVLVDALGAATVNIKTYFWFNGHVISPIKLKSALLRAVKTALTNQGISMPDEAREVIFPEGVRVLDGSEPAPKPAQPPVQITPPVEEPAVTSGEGDLLTDTPVDAADVPAEDEGDLLGPN